jgi:hypothetical protein
MRFNYASGTRPLDGFTIKRGIGVGGFGEVYFAVSDAGKEVALKQIQRNLDIEIRGVSQCLNLKHHNLIGLYDIRYDDEGQGWVVMEYVAGESLKEVIERNPNGLPEEEAIQWFRGIADGVAYLHDHGIVHRDLKPGNIFHDEHVVKIGDYGLSKFISCSRRSGQTESVGTFHYMAPEIGKGVYGKEIDIYALGIILFELLSGHVPYEGESSQEIIMKHLTADPDLRPVPPVYRQIVQKALAKDPRDRFDSVGELLKDVESARLGIAAAAPVSIRTASGDDVLYISDEPGDEVIYLGPVQETVAAEVVNRRPKQEPIAAVIRHGLTDLSSWWRQANLSTPVKAALLVGGVLLLILNSEWLIPLGVLAGGMYLVYYGAFSVVTAARKPREPVAPTVVRTESPPTAERAIRQPLPVVHRRARRRQERQHWHDAARETFAHRTLSENLSEANGSFLMAAIVAVVTSLLMLIIGGKSLDDAVSTWTFFTWLCLSSVIGAWTILAASKFWESNEGDQIRRRFVMLLAGLFIGSASFGIAEYLGVRLSDDLVVQSLPEVERFASMYEADGSPKLPTFLVYFAAMFASIRWWLQADPLRSSRLSIWATACCVLWAWIIHMFCQFPQPWGFMLAVTISAAVQLSAPWLSTRERSRIRRLTMDA